MMIEMALERALEKIAALEERVAKLEASTKLGTATEAKIPHLTGESLWSSDAENDVRRSLTSLDWKPLNGSERMATTWEKDGMIGEIKTTMSEGGMRYISKFVQVC